MLDIHAAHTLMRTFSRDALPDLNIAVLGALGMLAEGSDLPKLPSERGMLVVGSGNAASVGQIIYRAADAYVADESTYQDVLTRHRDALAGAVVVSASGGKHAVYIAAELARQQVPAWLITCNDDAPSREHVADDRVRVFPRMREPYTYNVSTYLGMLAAGEGARAADIAEYITQTAHPSIPVDTLSEYDAFYFVLPPGLSLLAPMLQKKFGELFGSRVSVRAYTTEQSKHGEFIVPSAAECLVDLTEGMMLPGAPRARIRLPLPEDAGYALGMAVCYYLIGCIQAQHPPYFKEHIGEYARSASETFGEQIDVIVS